MKEAGVNYLAYIIWILFIFSVLVVCIGLCLNTIKNYMDRKVSENFTILNSSDSADVAVFKSENPFCLRYIIQPKC